MSDIFNIHSVWGVVPNAIFNNISAISWWSVLLVEETGVPRDNYKSPTNFIGVVLT